MRTTCSRKPGNRVPEHRPPRPRDAARLVFGHLTGFLGTHLINLGLELGLFEALNAAEDGADADALAGTLGLHPPYVDSWLKGAHALELVDEAGDGRFKPAPYINIMLGNEQSMMDLGPVIRLFCRQMNADAPLAAELYRSGAVETFQEKGDWFSGLVGDATQHVGRLAVAEAVPQIPGLEDRLRAGGAILDMGCGCGRVVAALAQSYPACRVHGLDIDDHAIARAKQYLQDEELTDRADVETLHGSEMPYENAFDLVTMVLVLHECMVEHRDSIVENCYRALKPGGALLVCDENYPVNLEDGRRPKHQFAVMGQWTEATMGNVFLNGDEQIDYLKRHGFADMCQIDSQAGLLLTWGLKP